MAAPLRIGMIGAGGNARGHGSRLMQLPDVVVPAAADPAPATEALTKALHPKARELAFFADYKEMLAEVELDAVVISTPHTLHAEHILASLDGGLDVLCEKPLVCTVAEARDVIAKARESGKRLMCSYQRHLTGPFRYMRDCIANGQIGEVRFIQTFMAQAWYKSQQGKWRQDPKLAGGGQLNDSGSHILDIMMWATGLVPKQATAFIENYDAAVDIDSAVNVEFEGGALAAIGILGTYPRGMVEITSFIGTDGALHFGNPGGRQSLMHMRGDGTILEVNGAPGHGNPDQHFVDVLRGRCESDLEPDSALRVLALTEAAWKSAAAGGKPTPVEKV